MKTFLKTFFVCLILCVGWFTFMYFEKSGFDHDFDMTTEIYKKVEEEKPKEEKELKETVELKKVKLYFLNSKNKIVTTERTTPPLALKDAINLLLSGVNQQEKQNGLYSEIPVGVRLLNVDETTEKIVINLNSKFVQGGGTTTIMNRIKQLVKTVNAYSGKKPIYIHIEGKKVEYIGGDGVYLEQPINEQLLEAE